MQTIDLAAAPAPTCEPARPRTGLAAQHQARSEATSAYAFCLPALLLMLAIFILPIITVVVLSVTDYELGAPDFAWVGSANFAALAADPVFWRAMRNTFTYAAIVVPAAVGIGLLATVWHFVLHPQLGPLNAFLKSLGLAGFDVFADPDLVLAGLAVIGVWQLVGFNMILFLAGLTAIPQDLYDAADVEGADHPVDRFLRVTWPLLGPTAMFVVITTCITAFKVFDTIVVLTRGGPLGRSEVLLYAMYLEGFQYFRIGYASALALVFLLLVVSIAAVQAFLIDRRVHYA